MEGERGWLSTPVMCVGIDMVTAELSSLVLALVISYHIATHYWGMQGYSMVRT